MSTPAIRAMFGSPCGLVEVWCASWKRASARGVTCVLRPRVFDALFIQLVVRVLLKPCDRGLALALLMARIALADNHYAAVAADHLAVIANWLDAGVDLHVI